METLTLKTLKELPENQVFASGLVENSPEGVYITDNRKGHKMRWVAKRGIIHDWAIHIHWAERDEDYVVKYGDKVRDEKNIRKLVPCDNEALDMYRF